jgi:hypothetical protein
MVSGLLLLLILILLIVISATRSSPLTQLRSMPLFIWYKLLLLLLLILLVLLLLLLEGSSGANMDTRIDSVLQPYSTHLLVRNGTEPVGGLVGDEGAMQLCRAVLLVHHNVQRSDNRTVLVDMVNAECTYSAVLCCFRDLDRGEQRGRN